MLLRFNAIINSHLSRTIIKNMKNFNFLFTMIKRFQNTSDIPQLTQALKSSQNFRKMCMKVHHMKEKLKQKLHDEAFPQEKAERQSRQHIEHRTSHHSHKKDRK